VLALRTSLIWHDEVMDDIVLAEPKPVTLGTGSRATYTVPGLNLPEKFAIARPGNRGYLLTLGEHMRGTICIDGTEQNVADFVRADSQGGFRATPIGGKDWGVIELDGTGTVKLYFQFVEVDDRPQFFTKRMLVSGGLGYVVSALVLAAMFYAKGVIVGFSILGSDTLAEIAECLFRGAVISGAALAISGIVWGITRQEGDSQASLAFSIILHAALLYCTYQFYDPTDPWVWPESRNQAGNYLVVRADKPPETPPEKPKPTVGEKTPEAPAPKSPEPPKHTATKGEQGAAGGKGDTERARDPNAKDVKPEAPKVAFFEDKNKKYLDNILDRNISTNLSKFTGLKGDTLKAGSLGFGGGTGTGVGDFANGTGTTRGSHGHGSGGGGNVEGDFVTNKGPIDTGKNRPSGKCVGAGCTGAGPREVKVAIADPTGDFGGLTADEIDRVVKSRAGIFKACYQKELNHTPGIGGKLVVHFKITGDGAVEATATAAGTTLHNDGVESCVKSNVMRLKFPAKGGVANVNYPFVFSQGG
jgi:hypothetical protein